MRPSPFRHPLAVLRSVLNLGQREMGELAGCARTTVQMVELLHLKLSDDLALRISKATGVSEAWLLKGDPDVPIIDTHGAPYTRETFERIQSENFGPIEVDAGRWAERPMRFAQLADQLHSALRQAERDERLRLVDYKIHEAISSIAQPYTDFVPDFIGDVTPETKTMISGEFPNVLESLLLGEELLLKKAFMESSADAKKEISEFSGEIAAKLKDRADFFLEMAKAFAATPSESPSPKPQQKVKAAKTARRPSASPAPGKKRKAD